MCVCVCVCVCVFMYICYGNPVKYHSLTDILAILQELSLFQIESFRTSLSRDVWTVDISNCECRCEFKI
jgi:hypothetical protein